ncbi:hypothetical protein O2N63_16875 [Aliiroseovarius sp. KMU-50]|uniref:Uncharacterized protein n=1 Tax=Aliiroseovarius salicola TaxID=3009082 RepID=A0ABT4W5J9_9RHOB|nr:hypothetical protein [Aliiroseovarius sp. KMU-50]MDA5095766.1 hypothetical protein [Aliiroseovarius sp. KMU-50]
MKIDLTCRAFVAAALPACLAVSGAHANEFQIFAPDEASLTVSDGVVTAQLSSDGCAPGFETACSATRQRTEYQSSSAHRHGDRIAYRWEVNVPSDNILNAVDNHLYAVRFLAGETPVLQFIVGNEYGYEVNRKTCFGPDTFGEWHSVEVRVMWDSTKKKSLKDKTPGEIHIICDGNEVFSKTGRPNIKEGDMVNFSLGLEGALKLADGDKVSVSYRNIEIGSW